MFFKELLSLVLFMCIFKGDESVLGEEKPDDTLDTGKRFKQKFEI